MLKYIFPFLAMASLAFAGDGPSNGGDPAQFQVYDRARFGLEKVKLAKMLSPEHTVILEDATLNLVVEPDRALATMGEVKPDPTRGGKRIVYINPKLFLEEFDRRDSTLDLTQWVIHEVLQTKMNPATVTATSAGRAYDTDEEISRTLQFEEKEFELWRKRQNPGYPIAGAPALPNLKLLTGYYESAVFVEPQITYEADWDVYYFSSPRRRIPRALGYGISDTANSGPERIALKAVVNPKGQVTYVNADPITYHHTGNWCAFDYSIEIRPTEGGMKIREKFPLRSWGTGGKNCTLYENEWHDHNRITELGDTSLRFAYEAWIDRAATKEEKALAELFYAVSIDKHELIKAALAKKPNTEATDWRGLTPRQYAVRVGHRVAVYHLAPLKPITYDEYFYASLNLDGKVCLSSPGGIKNGYIVFDVHDALFRQPSDPRGVAHGLRWLAEHRLNKDILEMRKEEFLPLLKHAASLPAQGEDLYFAAIALLQAHTKQDPQPELRDLGLAIAKKGFPESFHARLLAGVLADGFDTYFWELIAAGINPKAKNDEQQTLIHLAVKQNRLDVAQRLAKDFGVDPQAKDKAGHSPLAYVIGCGSQAAVDWLLPLTDVNSAPEPLLVTVARQFKENHTDACQFAQRMERLFDKNPGGALPDGTDADGYSALDYLVLLIKRVSQNYKQAPIDYPPYRYALQTYRWLRDTKRVPLRKVEAPPAWIINGGWHP